jgi:hypothetical protein
LPKLSGFRTLAPGDRLTLTADAAAIHLFAADAN